METRQRLTSTAVELKLADLNPGSNLGTWQKNFRKTQPTAVGVNNEPKPFIFCQIYFVFQYSDNVQTSESARYKDKHQWWFHCFECPIYKTSIVTTYYNHVSVCHASAVVVTVSNETYWMSYCTLNNHIPEDYDPAMTEYHHLLSEADIDVVSRLR